MIAPVVAAVILVCSSGQCNQLGGHIDKAWCGKQATLERPASMGGNVTIRVQCEKAKR